jgi:hypothetical protein
LKVTIRNLDPHQPYSTDFETSQGEMIRILVPPGGTVSVTDIDPYYLNQDKILRKTVSVDGGQITYTPTSLGYECSRVGGYLIVGFEREPDDLIALVLPPSGGGGGGADEKVKISAADTTPGFLTPKIIAGAGITLTTLFPGANEKLEIAATATAAGNDTILFGADALTATTTTRYLYPGYSNSLAQVTPVQYRVPRSGVIRNMRVRQNTTAGNGNTIVYTFRKNAAAQTLTATLASTATDGSDLINSFPVAAGDLLDVAVTKALNIAGSPTDIVVTAEFTG